jgi:hypothetical protein
MSFACMFLVEGESGRAFLSLKDVMLPERIFSSLVFSPLPILSCLVLLLSNGRITTSTCSLSQILNPESCNPPRQWPYSDGWHIFSTVWYLTAIAVFVLYRDAVKETPRMLSPIISGQVASRNNPPPPRRILVSRNPNPSPEMNVSAPMEPCSLDRFLGLVRPTSSNDEAQASNMTR